MFCAIHLGFNNHLNVGHLFCLCIFETVVDYMFAVNGGDIVRVQHSIKLNHVFHRHYQKKGMWKNIQ